MSDDFSTKTCLFIGRFQPFHTGQLMVIEGMAKVCGRVVIVIGSSNEVGTREHPFSFDERREMIQRVLQEKNLIEVDISIVGVPDQPTDEAWIAHVRELVGPFHAVWTGKEDVKALCEAHGIQVKEVKHVPGFRGEDILQMMRDGDGFWTDKVPDDAATYIKSIEGPKRVRNLG